MGIAGRIATFHRKSGELTIEELNTVTAFPEWLGADKVRYTKKFPSSEPTEPSQNFNHATTCYSVGPSTGEIG